MSKILTSSLLAVLLASLPVAAGVTAVDGSLHTNTGATAPHESSHHDFERHHLGIFLGYARKDTEEVKDGGKIGFEYEYQFHEQFGARGFVDYEGGKLDTWLYGAGLSWHVPRTHLVLFAGPAFDAEGGKADWFVRTSAEYKFRLGGGLFLAPVIGYDWGRPHKSAGFVGAMIGTSF